jgi:hypothetical protein
MNLATELGRLAKEGAILAQDVVMYAGLVVLVVFVTPVAIALAVADYLMIVVRRWREGR